MTGPAAPLLLAVDGDGLLHRSHHAGGADRDARGRPVWAVRGLMTSLASAAARFRPDAVLVAFDCRGRRNRSTVFPDYKANRPDRDPELDLQLRLAADVFAAAGVPMACLDGHEGDDVLASAAALARAHHWRCIVVTSDRDSFALLDATTSVLRVVNGGVGASSLVTPEDLIRMLSVRPDRYRDYAALRGDPSDNLPGVKGVGPALAARLIDRFGSCEALLDAVDAEGPDAVRGVVGPVVARRLAERQTRGLVERNCALMTMRADLPLPPLGALRLPLDRTRLMSALGDVGIRLTGSLWALVGEDEPPWASSTFDAPSDEAPVGAPPPWAVLRPETPVPIPEPALAPVTLPRTVPVAVGDREDQLSLF